MVTPPLELRQAGPGFHLIDATGDNIAACTGYRKDLEQVVFAFNAQPGLLTACRTLLAIAEGDDSDEAFDWVREVIATAEGRREP